MPVPVTMAHEALEFDSLPALKVRHYPGAAPLEKVYALARFYFQDGALQASICAFEREPPATSGIVLAVGQAQSLLLFSLTPLSATLRLCEGERCMALACPAFSRFSGSDEQGWYWGAQFALPPETLAQVGIEAAVGGEFKAAVLKTSGGAPVGASFDYPAGSCPYHAHLFTAFAAVPY